MKRLQRPLSTFIKSRGMSAAAAARQVQQTGTTAEVELTTLPNGMQVASLENNFPISRIAIVYNAGSRYETGRNQGVTHAIRTAAYLPTAGASSLKIVKSIQHEGGSLVCNTTRDHMVYNLTVPRNGLSSCLKLLPQSACHPLFNFWDLEGQSEKYKLDLGLLAQCPDVQLIEALHQAAYRGGLGNSLYMPAYTLRSHDQAKMAEFVSQHYSAANMALVGVGIDHVSLTDLAKKIEIQDGQKMMDKANYTGGEVRINNFNDIVHAAIVTECPGGNNMKDSLALAVLKHVMCSGSQVKYSTNASASRLNKAIAAATTEAFTANCIMASYADSGLFGFQVAANSKDMAGVLQAAVKSFGEATKNIPDADIQLAKTQLKSSLLMDMESGSEQFENLCHQVILSGSFTSVDTMLQAIDAVTPEQVQSIAKQVINKKPSMAAVGDLSNTPHLDQLM